MKKNPLIGYISALIPLAFLLVFTSFKASADDKPYRIKTIVIDAGHGGKYTGATGRYSKEKDVTLQVAMKLGKAIEENMKDVTVMYTRTRDMHFEESNSKDLKKRIDMANEAKADLWISVHCNSMGSNTKNRTSVRGVETFVAGFARLNEQDAAIKEYMAMEEEYKLDEKDAAAIDPATEIFVSLVKNTLREQSIKLATFIQNEYIASGRVNRGVQELSLAVLRTATMPAVLTEIGFISNPTEEDYINSPEGQAEIVSNIVNAIKTYKRQVEL
ncbi:N-acetylmuramoyl-L-alanine amidase family protein [Daejeonella lutea]|uniref:N-acetylmuramoyl-L-alanine amidase n=1 Tax=Daejeonella lutea TaxID=572036 RepID=A0A1T4ZXW7_9SPHI|nr:N-acetylmuramoyl-L-alanine amidase [Daejeonella lutea]SKB27243.1 N-acetylmuramoyl-L-alanine amidase [Daejeonella lutea]